MRRHEYRQPPEPPDWPGYALCFCLGAVSSLFCGFLVFMDKLL